MYFQIRSHSETPGGHEFAVCGWVGHCWLYYKEKEVLRASCVPDACDDSSALGDLKNLLIITFGWNKRID